MLRPCCYGVKSADDGCHHLPVISLLAAVTSRSTGRRAGAARIVLLTRSHPEITQLFDPARWFLDMPPD